MDYSKSVRVKLLAIFLIFAFIFSGCSNSANKTTNNTSTETNLALTSTEASLLAYNEALKWNRNASIWYLSPVKIDKGWEENDRALWWTVVFVNPDNNNEIQVYIHDGKISGVDDVGNKRDIEINKSYPVNKLLITMKDAAKTAIANGAIKGLMPDMVYYDTESISFPGRPVWSIVYRPTATDGSEEIHIYFIDGLTGEFITVVYKDKYGHVINASDSKVTTGSASSSGQSQNLGSDTGSGVIYDFFSKVNSNNIDEAIALMDGSMTQNQASRDMWVKNLSSLNKVEVTDIKEYSKNEWTSDIQKYEVTLEVTAGNNAAEYGWSGGANTRWITVKMSGGKWLIGEIATGR